MSKKKNKTPLLLKIIRTLFPLVEKFFPILAYRYFIKLFFTPLHYPFPEKEKEMARRAEQFTFQAANKTIQAYRWGSGPIVLFVHGWAGRGTQFRNFVEPFTSKGFQVIAFDGPAHGQSEGKTTDFIEFEITLEQLFLILPDKPVGIITHSFGGAATLYSIMKGLPVTKLINIASPTIGDEVIKTFLRAINGSSSTGNYFKEYIVKRFGKTFDQFSGLHFIQHLPNAIDLLLIYDEDDEEVIMLHAEELVKLYPTAKLIRTKGLGHTRILKDAHVIETCLRFIASER